LARANSKWVGWPILGPVIAGWEEGFCAVRPSNLPCAGCEAVRHGRKTPGDYHTLAGVRGFAWLGPAARNTNGPTTWRCALGHVWTAPYNRLQKGSGCPVCAKHARRTDEAYHALAAEKGLGWRGPDVPNRQTPTNWVCYYGHTWAGQFGRLQPRWSANCQR